VTDEPNQPPALVPVRQQTVDFYGDTLPAAQLADGSILVPMRPIVDALGLNWPGQFLRIRREPVLHEALTVCIMQTVQGEREMLALPLKLLPGFLFGLNASRVKPELRDKILRYQRDCYEVLWTAFKGDIVPAAATPPVDLNPAEQALLLAEAVASLARQHLDLEQRHLTMADYLRPFVAQTKAQLSAHEERIGALEVRLGAGATISEEQAAEIQVAVKNVAMLLITSGSPNGFAQVWGELYRRYRVGAYRNLPAARYEEALAWLQGWYGELEQKGTS
jgi:hypothetical protein